MYISFMDKTKIIFAIKTHIRGKNSGKSCWNEGLQEPFASD